MLLRYIVSNFKSIGHPVEFSMFPVESTQDTRFLKSIITRSGTWKILRRSGFFGPNAAGKSSFIESVAFARDFIVDGQKSGKGTRIDQFRGDFEELKGISTFQFVFYLDEEVYEYGFSIDRYQVYEEWLMQLDKTDFVPLFTRVTDTNGKTEIDIESRFARKNSKERILAEILKDSIQENQKNQLFLYKLHDNGIKKAEKIVSWFSRLQIIFPETKVKALPIRMKADIELRNYIGEMLSKLDTGVFKISVASKEIDFHDFANKLQVPQDILEEIVGEIYDEYDEVIEKYTKLDENTFVFDGSIALYEVEKLLNIKIPAGDYETLSGYLIEVLGRIPAENEKPVIETEKITYKVEKCKDKRILKVKACKNNEII